MRIPEATKGRKINRPSSVEFLLRLITDKKKLELFPLSDRGRHILELAWSEQKSFTEIASEVNISRERVGQLYHLVIRRLAHFIEVAYEKYKTLPELKKKNELLKSENELLKKYIDCLKTGDTKKVHKLESELLLLDH